MMHLVNFYGHKTIIFEPIFYVNVFYDTTAYNRHLPPSSVGKAIQKQKWKTPLCMGIIKHIRTTLLIPIFRFWHGGNGFCRCPSEWASHWKRSFANPRVIAIHLSEMTTAIREGGQVEESQKLCPRSHTIYRHCVHNRNCMRGILQS